MNISRRSFLKGATATLLATALPTSIVSAEEQSTDTPILADETLSTEIVIVGAGLVGMMGATRRARPARR